MDINTCKYISFSVSENTDGSNKRKNYGAPIRTYMNLFIYKHVYISRLLYCTEPKICSELDLMMVRISNNHEIIKSEHVFFPGEHHMMHSQ